jgi:hypothetical protein
MEKILDSVNSVVRGPAMLALPFGTHIYPWENRLRGT